MATNTNLKKIVFNKLSKEKYEELKQAGQLNANEFYITPDESVTQDVFNAEIAKKADKSYVDQELAKKADSTDLDDLKEELAGDYATKEELESEVADLEAAIELKADKSSVYTKQEIDGKLTGAFHYKGTKSTWADLPTSGNETGDVWNVETADASHNLKAGDNVCWNGTEWDVLSGIVDLSAYETAAQVDAKLALKADKSELSSAKSELEAAIAEKADADDLDELEGRVEALESTAEGLDDKFAAKADKTYVDTELAKKADASALSALESEIEETYATKEEVEEGLALKADKATTYTKTEVDKAIEDRIVAVIYDYEE